MLLYYTLMTFLVLPSSPLVDGRFYDTNTTDLSKCRVHYSRSEGSYKVFYEISELSFDTNLTVDLHFSVLALSDAHVLLSTAADVQKTDAVYEIVLGAGGNTFCDIRRMQKSYVQASKRIKDLLSGLDPTSFWIHFDTDGLLEVGREGEDSGFLSWHDPVPLAIKYFSFSTWPGVDAKWYFDCPKEGNDVAISEGIEPYLTDLDRLRRDMLSGYDRLVRPVLNHYDFLEIDMYFSPEYIDLEEHAGHLVVKGRMNITWTDNKLTWDPELYGNLASFHIFLDEIWTPPLININAVDAGKDVLGRSLMVIQKDGVVNWRPSFETKTWCDTGKMHHWPDDYHTCTLIFAFGRDRDAVNIKFIIAPIVNQNKLWTVVDEYSYMSTTKTIMLDMDDMEDMDTVVIRLTLKRNSALYTAVYYTPLLVIATCTLATFWVSPHGYLKITLGCLQMLIISVTLIALGLFLPVHSEKLPNIISLYTYSMYAVVLSILLAIVVINVARKRHVYNLPHALSRILTMPYLKFVLCMPEITEDLEYNGKSSSYKHFKEKSMQHDWMLLATFIDRISFLLFLIFILNLLFFNY